MAMRVSVDKWLFTVILLLVFIGLVIGTELNLVFRVFEVAALAVSTIVVAIITLDGETHWFEPGDVRILPPGLCIERRIRTAASTVAIKVPPLQWKILQDLQVLMRRILTDAR